LVISPFAQDSTNAVWFLRSAGVTAKEAKKAAQGVVHLAP
jgi:hypothetical protein